MASTPSLVSNDNPAIPKKVWNTSASSPADRNTAHSEASLPNVNGRHSVHGHQHKRTGLIRNSALLDVLAAKYEVAEGIAIDPHFPTQDAQAGEDL